MSHKYGYIANRVGVPSLALQKEKLIEHGVLALDVYENLEELLYGLREGDELVLYTTAILGRNKINPTFVAVAEAKGGGIYSTKSKRLYDCSQNVNGMTELSDAWIELECVTKSHIAEVGKQLGGRKPSFVWKAKDEIRKSRNEGMSFKELSEIHNASEATIRRILASD